MDIICPFHRCVEVNIDFSFFFCNRGFILNFLRLIYLFFFNLFRELEMFPRTENQYVTFRFYNHKKEFELFLWRGLKLSGYLCLLSCSLMLLSDLNVLFDYSQVHCHCRIAWEKIGKISRKSSRKSFVITVGFCNLSF